MSHGRIRPSALRGGSSPGATPLRSELGQSRRAKLRGGGLRTVLRKADKVGGAVRPGALPKREGAGGEDAGGPVE